MKGCIVERLGACVGGDRVRTGSSVHPESGETGRRRGIGLRGRGAEGPLLAPGLCIDTSLEEDDDATATPLPPTSKKQAEMFSLDDTGGHLRLSRLSKEGLDATVIVAEKDMSWLGESPTDTENSDCDEAQAVARARSPTGRHFHVWEVVGKTAKRGGDRPRPEARKERKGRVVQQFRRAVYEHQHAEELAKRKVLMESLSSSAGVIDVINLKKGESVKSRLPTMLQGGWVRGKALGSGTAATVYLAKRSVDDFLFVAKEVPLPGKNLLWSDLSRDMRNEAIVLSRARHIEGVVEFFGCEIIADKFYIYMEHTGVVGTVITIKKAPRETGCEALHHGSGGLMGSREGTVLALEDRGQLITPIMHRDVKGSNCLLSADRRTVKLCDFGSCTRPRPFSIAGTPLAAGGEKLNASIDLTADIPPDCCAIVIGFAPLESTFTREGEAEGQSGVVMESSLSTSEVLQTNSAERRYADPQFFFKSMKGTLLWMAPETLGGSEYSAKVDVWSIGCLLIEMVCGRDPWKEFDNEMQNRSTLPPLTNRRVSSSRNESSEENSLQTTTSSRWVSTCGWKWMDSWGENMRDCTMRVLEIYTKQCHRDGHSEEAWEAAEHLRQLKREQAKVRWEETERRHAEELRALEEELRQEKEECYHQWQEIRLPQLENSIEGIRVALAERQDLAEERYVQKLRKGRDRFIVPKRILDLTSRARFFALHGEDEKACEVMAVVEKEEVECIGRQEDLRRRRLAKLTTEFVDRQKEERVAVEKSVEGMRRKVMEEKRRELAALQRRAERRLAALHKKQKKELSRLRKQKIYSNSR
ncbi:hypothetical protein Pmar_PMAR007522 [Perkinsus marinus ATCC 50983]|uniref:Protein kinase domain-containing protein n=1 Tax=Perkinsus marinus (strain ATCC 50983 / TXsc) TaxID=423536 RepID=C5LAV9_PERM5|nr:hypothetical protein Pmar_PMAR007522 [Perkinsus marinus ATCC 50983]EER06128.1 hypothetical protein Pmar_PMAR007522 [Perkinsus marinus ATCC 50983]|eukprot:XP_002774312.1 hypothetical protein Pmar_PMAR007522 [Perkinsus marinus ATCC 50983]